MRLRTSGAERERNCRNARKFGRAPTARLYWESLFEREIIQNLYKIKQNLCVRLTAYFILGSLFEREIIQKLNSKINQKFIREHRRCSLAWGRSSSEKLTKIILKINQK